MAKLTKSTVDAARPEARERFIWDSELEGFGLRIFPSGRKSFIIQYRNADGRTRRLTLGPHGKITAAQARQMARKKLGEAVQGGDPAQERKESREAPTMAELAERFLVEHIEPKRKERTAKEYRRLLEKHVLPTLGRRKAEGLKLADIEELHHGMRKTPYLANRVVAVVSSMLSMAEKWGLRARGSNPCAHLDLFRERRRERFLSADELSRLGEVLTAAETSKSETWEAILALRLLLLTGCRKNEILTLRWSDVDLERGFLFLADSKTGAKAVPLGAPAVELLKAAPQIEGNPYVIPGRRGTGKHFVGLGKVWERVRSAGNLEGVRIHDLRHSFASVGAGGGHSLPILGKLLGHNQPSTTARYAHLAADPVRVAAEQISSELASALGSKGS